MANSLLSKMLQFCTSILITSKWLYAFLLSKLGELAIYLQKLTVIIVSNKQLIMKNVKDKT
jgi:hypothetical protein